MVGSAVALQLYDKEKKLGAIENLERSVCVKGARITISPTQTLKVVVTDTSGQPLPKLDVCLYVHVGGSGIGAKDARTDANGEALFDGLYKGGRYGPYVFLKKGLYAAPVISAPVGSEDWTGVIELTVEPADRRQPGIVVDKAGNPVSGAQVTAYVDHSPRVVSGPDGRFTLEGLPASTVKVHAQKDRLSGEADADRDTAELTIKVK